VAVADGYKRFEPGPGEPLMGEHWYRQDLVLEPLDLTQPSTLIYAPIGGERQLVAVAYTVYQKPGEPLPEGFAGDADRWHVHDVAGLVRIALSDRPVARWVVERRLERGPAGRRAGTTDLVMLHAWIGTDNPDGVFANRNVALPYARSGLPTAWPEPGNEAAARGVALSLPGACDGQLAALDRMAKLEPSQETAIRAACEAAAVEVTDAVGSALLDADSADASMSLNTVAARAWRGYELTIASELSREQEERIAALLATTRH
jgi:hypothetical protein